MNRERKEESWKAQQHGMQDGITRAKVICTREKTFTIASASSRTASGMRDSHPCFWLNRDVTATNLNVRETNGPQHAIRLVSTRGRSGSMTASSIDARSDSSHSGGLFTAHITGNIVILTAHYITGGFSRIGPLICGSSFHRHSVGTVVWLFEDKPEASEPCEHLLILHAALLTGFFAVSAAFGPFANPGGAVAASVGMLGVAAIATQNALVKLDLPGFPTTAVLTTNTVQLTVELTTLLRGNALPEQMALARRRIRMTLPAFAGFIAGCTGRAGCPRSALRTAGFGISGCNGRACHTVE